MGIDVVLGIIAQLVLQYVPPTYLAIIVLVLGILFLISEYLGKTERFKANSVLQAVTAGISDLLQALKLGKQGFIRIPLLVVVVLLAVLMLITACTTGSQVKSFEATTVTAETILYKARVAQNSGVITSDQFAKIADVYTKWRACQIVAIDAEKVYLRMNTADAKNKLAAALVEGDRVFSDLVGAAKAFKLLGGVN